MEEDLSRMTVVVDTRFHQRFRKVIRWGMRAKLVQIVLERIVDSVEDKGPIMIGAILSGEFSIVFAPRDSVPNRDTGESHE